MRIGVNAVPLRVWGGGARYCFTNLMEAMLARDDAHEYLIFAHFLALPIVHELIETHPQLRRRRRVRVVEVADEQGVMCHAAEFDVYFAPLNNLQPRIYDRPTVAILHDIQEQFFPEFFSRDDLEARREIYPEICRSATVLVTISEFCRQSIVEKFQIDPRRVEVVYNAPQQSLVGRQPGDVGVWRGEALPPRFVFYPANFYPHKNHVVLLDALARLRDAHSPHLPSAVFTGFEVAGGPRIHDEIARRGLSQHVIVLSKVDEDALRYLFCHARALVMPTLFEGFGMPAVEGMACGCPLILSDTPALREVAQDAAAYFQPTDAATLAAELERHTRDDLRRDTRAARGHQLAARFSWPRSAERIVQILEDAPRRFLGFTPAPGRNAADGAPTIAVLLSAFRGDIGVPESLKSIWATGYPHLRVEVVARLTPFSSACRALLDGVPVPHHEVMNGTPDVDLLLDLATRTRADLVGQVWVGNGYTQSGLHSIAHAALENPDALIYLGESWVSNDGGVVTHSARLRLRGEFWTLDGFLFPEMIFFRPAALELARAHPDRLATRANWRWELLKRVRDQNRLHLLRRSVGASRQSLVSFWRKFRASLDSTLDTDQLTLRRSVFENVEPVMRFAGRLLPDSLRQKGRRIWNHLKSDR